jgi:hypothetical protein
MNQVLKVFINKDNFPFVRKVFDFSFKYKGLRFGIFGSGPNQSPGSSDGGKTCFSRVMVMKSFIDIIRNTYIEYISGL